MNNSLPIYAFLAVSTLWAGCTLKWKGKSDSQSKAVATQDEGSTSKMHDEHMGGIVFAKSEIPRDGSPVVLQTRFRADEPIWSRYYMSKSLAKHMAGKPNAIRSCKWENRRRLDIFATIGDGPEMHYISGSAGQKTWSIWTTAQTSTDKRPLLPVGPVYLPQGRKKNGARLLLAFSLLPDGEYPVTMRVQASCLTGPKADVATGGFTVVVDAAARKTLIGQMKVTSSSFGDRAQLAQMTAMARSTFSETTIKDFRVIESAWRIERNDLGVPIGRHITGLTYYEKDDECTLVGSDIKENNQGGSSYGSPQFLQPRFDDRLAALRVPCNLEL